MPNVKYLTAERLELLRLYEQGLSLRQIVNKFVAAHPERPAPCPGTVRRIVLAYQKTGKITSRQKWSYPSRQVSDEMRNAICLMAEGESKKTVVEIGDELRLSRSTIWRILRDEKAKSLQSPEEEKPLPVPVLSDQEHIFSQVMIDRLNADENRLRRVCFTNECTILFASKGKKQYVRVCPWRIQHLLNKNVVEFQKLYVWIGIVENQLFGPFFVEGALDGDKYLKVLQEEIVPALRAAEGGAPIIWYKQNGFPVHYTPEVWSYLSEAFPDPWVGRYGPSAKPTSSLDMSLLDLALWGRLKNALHDKEKVEDLDALRNKVKEIICKMDPLIVCSTIRASYERNLKLESQK